MRLIRVSEAARELGVQYPMLNYWVRTGFITKHQIEGMSPRYYRIDLEQARDVVSRPSRSTLLRDDIPMNLITPAEAADILWVSTREISYYVKRGYLTPHFLLGNDKHYLVDKHELKEKVLDPMPDRMSHTDRKEELSRIARELPRDSKGHWAKKVRPTND